MPTSISEGKLPDSTSKGLEMTTGMIHSSGYALQLCVAISTRAPDYLKLRQIAITLNNLSLVPRNAQTIRYSDFVSDEPFAFVLV